MPRPDLWQWWLKLSLRDNKSSLKAEAGISGSSPSDSIPKRPKLDHTVHGRFRRSPARFCGAIRPLQGYEE